MNLNALRVFHEVVKCGGVTRAAESLSLSQPAVTAQIKNLEKELDLPLYNTKGKKFVLTDTGNTLFSFSKRLFGLEIEMEEKMLEIKEGRIGRLQLFSTNLPANYLIPKWMVQYKHMYSNIDIELTKGNSRAAYDALMSYSVDLAIVAGGFTVKDIEQEMILEDELWFVTSARHKYANKAVSLKELMREPFIYREEGSSTRKILLSMCERENLSPPPVGLRIAGLYESIRMIAAGFGIMLAPALSVAKEIEHGEIARIYVKKLDAIKRPIYLCTRKDEKLSPPVTRFIEVIQSSRSGV